MLFSKRAQSTAEYVLMAGVVIAVFVAMQTYVKRGIQGVVKTAADEMGKQADSEEDAHYGQRVTSANTTTAASIYNTQTSAGGSQTAAFSSTNKSSGTSTAIQYGDKEFGDDDDD